MALVVGRGRESLVYVYIVINRVKKRCALAAPKHRVFSLYSTELVCVQFACVRPGDRRRRGVVGVHPTGDLLSKLRWESSQPGAALK